jgi:rod shape-determining protein MreC
MENFFTRYKNPLVLMAVLVMQVITLATQIKRPEGGRPGASGSPGGTRLIRVWTVTAITPFETALVATGHFFRNTWHDYIDLHDVRRQNRELQKEVDRIRLEEVRLRNDAEQSQRLQALLDFRERYTASTVAAQVIGSSGSEQSRVIYIDKGSRAGIRQDMAVITPDGIVGKVRDVYPFSSQVLMINDHDSGAGVILESSRLHGILRGKEMGEIRINDILSDEKVDVGERVITSGGDRVYPKGLPVGTVSAVGPDPDASPFLAITLKPAADLSRLEEVLVVTKMADETPAMAGDEAHRAAEVLAERLPSIPQKPDEKKPEETAAAPSARKTPPQGAGANGEQPPKRPLDPTKTNRPPGQARPGAADEAVMSETKAASAPRPAVEKMAGAAQKKKPAESGAQPQNQPQPQTPDEAEKPPR